MRLMPTRALVAAVAVAAAVGTTLAAAPASAATAACGSYCASFYPLSTGTSDVLAVANPNGTNGFTGQAITIAAASSTNQGEDWVLEYQGTVDDFIAAGLMSQVMSKWGSDSAYEIDYAPNLTWTGLCMGVSSSNGSGAVSLQPCGVSAETLWVADTADQSGRAVPLINGANTTSSGPYGLAASSPGIQLSTSRLVAPISKNEDWGTIYGEL